MTGRKISAAILAGAVTALSAGAAFPALAEGEISEVKIQVREQYEPGAVKAPAVQVSGEESRVESVSWDGEVSSWKPGEDREAVIVLRAADGRRFETGSGNAHISVNGAEYVSSQGKEGGNLLEVKVTYTPVFKLGLTEQAGWDREHQGTAVWKPVPRAASYQICLYRSTGESLSKSEGEYINTMTLTGTSANLDSYMETSGTYYYTVKALPSKGTKGISSGNEVRSELLQVNGVSRAGWKRVHGQYQYIDEKGEKAADGWRYIDGFWYYFDHEGNAETGWERIGGSWYYIDDQGRMKTGWLNDGGNWYYLKQTGAMVTGWYELGPGNIYYFGEDGRMYYDTVVDGRRLESSGRAR